jgi:hypothetical protein
MINHIFRPKRSKQDKPSHPPAIRQRWVETADERCPIARTWSLVPYHLEEQEEEPDPIGSSIFLRPLSRALCILFTLLSRHPDGLNMSLLKV